MSHIPPRHRRIILIGTFCLTALIVTEIIVGITAPTQSVLIGMLRRWETVRPLADAHAYLSAHHGALAADEVILSARAYPTDTRLSDAIPYTPLRRWHDRTYAPQPPLSLERTSQTPAGLYGVITRYGGTLGNHFYDVLPPHDAVLEDPTDDVLLASLFCDRRGYDAHDLQILSMMRDGHGGYADTHHLIALLLVRDLGCATKIGLGTEVDTLIAAVTDTIATAALAANDGSDLAAERIVTLYWAGAGDRVRAAWIDTLIETQNPDGGWGAVRGAPSDPHATALAALALRYWRDGNIVQTLLR